MNACYSERWGGPQVSRRRSLNSLIRGNDAWGVELRFSGKTFKRRRGSEAATRFRFPACLLAHEAYSLVDNSLYQGGKKHFAQGRTRARRPFSGPSSPDFHL